MTVQIVHIALGVGAGALDGSMGSIGCIGCMGCMGCVVVRRTRVLGLAAVGLGFWMVWSPGVASHYGYDALDAV